MSSPTIAASILESHIQINVQSRDIESAALELAYMPPVYVDAKEIMFVTSQSVGGAPSATLEVYGLPSVLQYLTVSRSFKNLKNIFALKSIKVLVLRSDVY